MKGKKLNLEKLRISKLTNLHVHKGGGLRGDTTDCLDSFIVNCSDKPRNKSRQNKCNDDTIY